MFSYFVNLIHKMLNFMPPEEDSSSQYDDEQDNDAEVIEKL